MFLRKDLLNNLLQAFKPTKWLQPEELFFVIINETFVRVEHSDWKTEEIAWSNIKEIKLINNILPELVINADINIISLVVRNLVSNSIKFTPAEGSVAVSTKIKDDFAEVSITDTGVGISPENLEALFSAKIESTVGTNHEKGTGLGLLLCRELIEEQGGKIFAKSAPDKGTTITFTVSLAKNAPALKTNQ